MGFASWGVGTQALEVSLLQDFCPLLPLSPRLNVAAGRVCGLRALRAAWNRGIALGFPANPIPCQPQAQNPT